MSVSENGKRQSIFLALIEDGGTMTPSEIGNAVDETRQTVKYHLDTLAAQGLVVHDDGGYRAQPLFVDAEIEEQFVDWLAEFLPEVNERVIMDPNMAGEEQTAVVFNCIRAFVALELLGPPVEGDR